MRTTLVNLILGGLALNAVLAAAASAAALASWHVAIAVTILLALGLVVVSMVTRRASLAWAALIAFPAGVIGSMELDDYAALRRSEVHRVASPREAKADGSGFVFERAGVRGALRAEYRHSARTRASQPATITYYYAAPLVDESWTPVEPVPAWAVCRDERCTADWSRPCPAAIALPARHADEYRQVVAVAEGQHGLRSAAGAPMLACVASPEAALAAQLEAFRFAVMFWNAAWLSGWLGFGVWRLVRRRPATTAALLSLALLAGRAAAGPEEIPRGVIVERVACRSDPAESYALYLPSSLAPGGARPVIYAVDPAARGRLPVERLQKAAETYGYVVTGSNNARNGPAEPALRSLLSMIQDTRQRFAIDLRRTVLAGFSGRARLATQLARIRPVPVAAVVAVGAGLADNLSPRELPPTFFLRIVEQRDFNYRELLALEPRLTADGVDHGLIVTDGRHAWPSEEECVRAVEWLELRAMASELRARDAELIETVYRRESERAQAVAAGGDLTGAARAWDQIASLFRGLRAGSESEEKARQLRARDEFRRQAKREESRERRERDWLSSSRPILTALAAATTSELDPVRASRDLEVPRLLADLRKPDAAESARQADFLVALACAHAASRGEKQALASLREAIGKGFSDVAALREQKCFESLRATPAFGEILRSLESRRPE